ncbi:hypothetical protein AB0I51_20780 [Streptomyces sp. NPDC050549]|uniref:hypothetical protein n=1 Tax=Streptomyces sp. NPDC050549 TaxID=3155406 RepID=UPI00343F3A3E
MSTTTQVAQSIQWAMAARCAGRSKYRWKAAVSSKRLFGAKPCRRAKNPDLAVLGACHEPFHAMLSGRHDDVEELFVRAENGITGTALHWDRAVLRTNWTTYCLQRGDSDGARAHGRTAVAAARAAGDDYARAFSLVLRGDADESGGFRDRARAHWTEAVQLLGPIGARALYAHTTLRIVCLDIGEGAIATAEHRLAEVARLADELGADDLRATAAILRGALAFHGDRFPEARAIFAGVWDSPTAPLDRRAMSALGLAVVAAFGPPTPSAADEARLWRDRAAKEHDRVREPLAGRAVGALLDTLDTCFRSGPADGQRADRVRARLAGNPSVLAGFSGVLTGPGRHR